MKKDFMIVGIDVSKDKLDVFIHSVKQHFIVLNQPEGFSLLLEKICQYASCKPDAIFICFENTGKYSKQLSVFLHLNQITFVMQPALEIKRSLGLARGKNDKVDAQRIAQYAYEKQQSLKPTVLPGETIDKIKGLLSLRERLIKNMTAFKNAISDVYDCYQEGENDFIKTMQQTHIKTLQQDIEKVENEIFQIIRSDDCINQNYQLVISVKGVGKVNAFYFIAYTANFTLFSNPRSYACYCGVAPFDYSSGKYVGKSRVHHFANKQLKSLLNMAAMSAIQIKGEFKDYYNRRTIEQNKSEMSTLNIVRNKLISRVFAAVKRGTPYVDLNKFAA